MPQYVHFDAHKVERGNKRIGYLVSAIVHALVLLIILMKILELPTEPPAEYAIELLGPVPQYTAPVERDPGGGGSEGPEDLEPKEGGSPGSEAPGERIPEEAVKVEPNPEPEPVKPTPSQPSPKSVLVDRTAEVVKADPPKVEVPGPVRHAPPNP